MNRLFLSLCLGVAGGVLLASSCGPTRPPCTATTCTGCCDTTGECRTGLDNSACGSRGGPCAQCGLVSTCVSGACALNNNTGAGTAGGASGTGGGVAGGGSVGGGTGGGSVMRCNSSNCAGCCTDLGQCVSGFSVQECGTNGTTCIACTVGQSCSAGRCSSGSGGGAAGGGSTGGSGSCNATSCPTGCCQGGACQTPSASQCGRNGATCTRCNAGQTCVSGSCTPCTGCIDVGSGLCVAGASNAACGRDGGSCASCGAGTCSSGACVGGCTPSSCPSGCCDGQSCVPPASQSDGLCGRGPGMGGQACRACGGGQLCDMSAGDCVTGGGLDGGLPPIPDGGLGALCFSGSQCAPGECCFPIMGLGLCATIGNANLLGGTTCGLSQMTCSPTTCMPPQSCNALGSCQ